MEAWSVTSRVTISRWPDLVAAACSRRRLAAASERTPAMTLKFRWRRASAVERPMPVDAPEMSAQEIAMLHLDCVWMKGCLGGGIVARLSSIAWLP